MGGGGITVNFIVKMSGSYDETIVQKEYPQVALEQAQNVGHRCVFEKCYTLSCIEHYLDPWSLLSPPAYVLSSSPGSQDSIEWSNISVGGVRPNLWLF